MKVYRRGENLIVPRTAEEGRTVGDGMAEVEPGSEEFRAWTRWLNVNHRVPEEWVEPAEPEPLPVRPDAADDYDIARAGTRAMLDHADDPETLAAIAKVLRGRKES